MTGVLKDGRVVGEMRKNLYDTKYSLKFVDKLNTRRSLDWPEATKEKFMEYVESEWRDYVIYWTG